MILDVNGKVYIYIYIYICTIYKEKETNLDCFFEFFLRIGPWRWFDESMLDCCEPLEVVKEKGISFGKVVCLAHCSGAKVEAFRTNQTTIDDFRKLVMKCSTSENCHMISTYHRGVFKQVTSASQLLSACNIDQDSNKSFFFFFCRLGLVTFHL